MIFLRDNFARDSGLWNDIASAGVISFSRGRKKYVKNATSWSTLGSVLKEEHQRILRAGDTFRVKFIPVTYTYGTPLDPLATFWQFGLLLDNNNFRTNGYGVYLNAESFQPMNGPNSYPEFGLSVDTGTQYTLVLQVQSDSTLGVYLGENGNVQPIYTIPGPFLNRKAFPYLNVYSVDTVELLDISGHDVEGT